MNHEDLRNRIFPDGGCSDSPQPPAMAKICYINSGIFVFETLNMMFPETGAPARLVSLLGGNGSGKTSVLSSLQFALIPDVRDMDLDNNKNRSESSRADFNASALEFFFPVPEESFILFEFRNCRSLGTVTVCVYKNRAGKVQRLSYRGEMDGEKFIRRNSDGGFFPKRISDTNLVSFLERGQRKNYESPKDYFEFLKSIGIYKRHSDYEGMKAFFRAYVNSLVTKESGADSLRNLMLAGVGHAHKNIGGTEINLENFKDKFLKIQKLRFECAKEWKEFDTLKKLAFFLERYENAKESGEKKTAALAQFTVLHLEWYRAHKSRLERIVREASENITILREEEKRLSGILPLIDRDISDLKKAEDEAEPFLLDGCEEAKIDGTLKDLEEKKSRLNENLENARKAQDALRRLESDIDALRKAGDCIEQYGSAAFATDRLRWIEKRIEEIEPEIYNTMPVDVVEKKIARACAECLTESEKLGLKPTDGQDALRKKTEELEDESARLGARIVCRDPEDLKREIDSVEEELRLLFEDDVPTLNECLSHIDSIDKRSAEISLEEKGFDSEYRSSKSLEKEIEKMEQSLNGLIEEANREYIDIPFSVDDGDNARVLQKAVGETRVWIETHETFLHGKTLRDIESLEREIEKRVCRVEMDFPGMSTIQPSNVESEITEIERRMETLQSLIDASRSKREIEAEKERLLERLETIMNRMKEMENALASLREAERDLEREKPFPYALIEAGASPSLARDILKVMGSSAVNAVHPSCAGAPIVYVEDIRKIGDSVFRKMDGDIYKGDFFRMDMSKIECPFDGDLTVSAKENMKSKILLAEKELSDTRKNLDETNELLKKCDADLLTAKEAEKAKKDVCELNERNNVLRSVLPLLKGIVEIKGELHSLEPMRPILEQFPRMEKKVDILERTMKVLRVRKELENALPEMRRRELLMKEKAELTDRKIRLLKGRPLLEKDMALRGEFAKAKDETPFFNRKKEVATLLDVAIKLRKHFDQIEIFNRLLERSVKSAPLRTEREELYNEKSACIKAIEMYRIMERSRLEFRELGGKAAIDSLKTLEKDIGEVSLKLTVIRNARRAFEKLNDVKKRCSETYRLASVSSSEMEILKNTLGTELSTTSSKLESETAREKEGRDALQNVLLALSETEECQKNATEVLGNDGDSYFVATKAEREAFVERNPDLSDRNEWFRPLLEAEEPLFTTSEGNFSGEASAIRKKWTNNLDVVKDMKLKRKEALEKMKSVLERSGIDKGKYLSYPSRDCYDEYLAFSEELKRKYPNQEVVEKSQLEKLASMRQMQSIVADKIPDAIRVCKELLDSLKTRMNRALKNLGGTEVAHVETTVAYTPLADRILHLFDDFRSEIESWQMPLFKEGESLEEPKSDSTAEILKMVDAEGRVPLNKLFVIDFKILDSKMRRVVGASTGNSLFSTLVLTACILRLLESDASVTYDGGKHALIPVSLDESGKIDKTNSRGIIRFLDRHGFFVISAEPESTGVEAKSETRFTATFTLEKHVGYPARENGPDACSISRPICYLTEDGEERSVEDEIPGHVSSDLGEILETL